MFFPRQIVKVVYIIILMVSVVFLASCRLLLSLSGPIPIEYDDKSLALSWDAAQESIEESSSATSYFNIYYRDLGSADWIFLKTTTDSQCFLSIRHVELGDGDFEFAVQAVYNNGRTSELHSSSDFSAWPSGGWYLKWRT